MLPGDPLVRGVVRGAGAAAQVRRVVRPLPGDGAALAGAEATVSTDRRIALLLDVFDQAFDRRGGAGTPPWGCVAGPPPPPGAVGAGRPALDIREYLVS